MRARPWQKREKQKKRKDATVEVNASSNVIPLQDERRKAPPTIEAELRATLKAAIARRDDLDRLAATAKETAHRAEALHIDARRVVDEFRARHDANVKAAREAHAHAISECIRAGKTVPGTPPPAALDIAALQAAEQQAAALEVSSIYLAVEANEAADAAAKAASEARLAATAVYDHIMRRKHLRLLAAQRIVNKERRDLSGFHILDEQRPGGAAFAAEKHELTIQLTPYKALVAEHPELDDDLKRKRYQDAENAAAVHDWQAYHGRLCQDAAAAFDTEESSQ